MLIDTHMHIGKQPGHDLTEEMVITLMKKYHVDYAIVSDLGGIEYTSKGKRIPRLLQKSQKKIFKESVAFARKYSDMIGIMPWIKPVTESVDDDFKKLMEENEDVVCGIKLHSFYSRIGMDADKVRPYIEIARRYNIPMVCHTGGCEEADPIHVYLAAVTNPDVRFVMVHMGLGTDNSKAIELMQDAPNLYADTTWVPMETTIEVVRRYGSKRVVFGSDSPIDGVDTYKYNPKGEPSMYREYFERLKDIIGVQAYEDIMYRNAIDVFNLKKGKHKNYE